LAKEAAADLGLEVKEAAISTSGEVQQAAQSLDVDAFYVPTDNNVVSALESMIQVAETKGILMIAAEGDSVARGAVATYGINYEQLGRQTGEMAVRILKGEGEPATMPVETQKELELYVNPAAAERMGVTLPAGFTDKADHVTE
jgi:putative ABC transport system substrate-binding protein